VQLNFCTKDKATEECLRKAYVLYLWLNTLYEATFLREPDGGNHESALIARIGSKAFKTYMHYMQIEMPIILYAHHIAYSQRDKPCHEFYTDIGFD